jgi:transcriptional regulator with XRE-family HTH domain
MTARQGRLDTGLDDARRARGTMSDELRAARLAAGISQATAARAVGMSTSQWARLERNELTRLNLVQLCCAARAVGLRASLKLYPAGDAVRDAPQLAGVTRFAAVLASPLRLRREVPLPGPDELRAWDGRIDGGGPPFFMECESHASDAQALERRLRMKQRDDPAATLLILVLVRSRHHQAFLREHREVFRDLLPLDGPAILRALRAGRRPGGSGILVL